MGACVIDAADYTSRGGHTLVTRWNAPDGGKDILLRYINSSTVSSNSSTVSSTMFLSIPLWYSSDIIIIICIFYTVEDIYLRSHCQDNGCAGK